jgi:hypothetical protein
MKHVSRSILLATLPFLLATPYGLAQMPQAPTPAEAQAALNPAPSQFTNAQLDQMVAPIALYPDQLLTQVLMASTFPDQLVDAQKWLQDGGNAALKGDDLANALQPLPWDPSVKSLVAFPQIIAMMINHLDWTQALGTAFASQEVQVFARVQFLRGRAKQAGFLKTTSQIAVTEQASDIIIEPVSPDEVYVPVYNPADVYGSWPDNDYPPVYLPPPPGFYEGALGAGIGFSVGFGIVAPLWGWGHPNWHNHEVVIDPGRYQHITSQTYIIQNHINIEGGAWHRSGPIAMVPQAQRPAATYHAGEPPKGTVQPSAVFRPGGPGPAGEHGAPNAGPNAGPRPAGQGQPGPAARPNEAQPGPHPAGQSQPGPAAHPNEVQPGPHPAGQAQPEHPPEEHGAPQAQHPPEEHGPPQAQHPAEEHGPPPQAQHPPEEHGPPPQAQHPPEEHGPPPQAQHPPEEHGPPPQAQHPPEEHGQPPQAQHPPEEHGPPPQAQHPPEEHGPPPQAPHPQGPPPQAAHPAPQPQQHPAGPPPKAPPKPGDEDHH